MDPQRIDVFFYGTLMSPDVLSTEFGIETDRPTPARLTDYHLTITPRVNIEPRVGSVVYGSVAAVEPNDVTQVYDQLDEAFGIRYVPTRISAIQTDGTVRDADVYIAPIIAPGPVQPDYVRQLAACVRSLGHPEAYARHVESFLPPDRRNRQAF